MAAVAPPHQYHYHIRILILGFVWMPLVALSNHAFLLPQVVGATSRHSSSSSTRITTAFLSLVRRKSTPVSNIRQSRDSITTIAATTTNRFATFPSKSFGGSSTLHQYRGGATTSSSGSTTACFSSSSNENENDNDDTTSEDVFDKNKQTGWNHNLPDPNSPFWDEAPNGAPRQNTSSSNKANSSNDNNTKKNDEPRTGWLHNTKPASTTSTTTKQEQKQKQEETSQARRRLERAMKEQEQNHRMISPPTFHACGEGRCMVVTEHMISVPLYRNKAITTSTARSPRIDLYFAIVEKATETNTKWLQQLQQQNQLSPNQKAKEYVLRSGLVNGDDMILYLQGGPGFGSPTPMFSLGFSKDSSWAASALDHYSRVILMDQRGTGRSTAITKQTLQSKFPDLFLLDNHDDDDDDARKTTTKKKSLQELVSSHPYQAAKVEQAVAETTDYMTQFRADNIVLDAEDIKDALLLPTEEPVTDRRPWGAALGQSFGGFCMMTYLSQVANPPRICLLTGGIAPMSTPVLDAYSSLWSRVKERSLRYYEMYPGDIPVVKRIVQKLLKDSPVMLPSGGTLTARRFLQLGLGLGGSPSSFASFHAMLSTAMINQDHHHGSDFTRAFLKYVDTAQSFDDCPIYFWLHESIYGDGPTNSPTNWAAHRAYENLLVEGNQEYDYQFTSSRIDDDSQPTLFFGEMVFPWMPEDFEELGGVGLQAVADALASKTDWGNLYNGDNMRKVLRNGTCKAAAAVYFEDMYVDFGASMKLVARGGPLENCKVWVTNEYQHSGLRDGGSQIFTKLHSMAVGGTRTPS